MNGSDWEQILLFVYHVIRYDVVLVYSLKHHIACTSNYQDNNMNIPSVLTFLHPAFLP